MGAGNPLIKNYDGEGVVTYFADLTDPGHEYQEFEIDLLFEDFNNIWFNLEGVDAYTWNKAKRESALSAANRGEGIIIAETEHLQVVVCSESMYHHIGFGFIPRYDRDEIEQEMYNEHGEKEKWYDARGLDFNARIEQLAQKKIDDIAEKAIEEENAIKKQIVEMFSDERFSHIFSVRSGPWTSSSLTKKEFLRL